MFTKCFECVLIVKVQGIGGGGMICLVEVTVTDMVGLNERGAFAGIVALSWALGTVLGPIMGGAIAENTTWRWYYPKSLSFLI
jgi:MFS family permease